jgi:hypothetical protein
MPRPRDCGASSILPASPLDWVGSSNAIRVPTAKKHKSLFFQCVTRKSRKTLRLEMQTFCSSCTAAQRNPQELAAGQALFSSLTRGSASLNGNPPFTVFQPMLTAVAGHVHGQLEAAPDSHLVEGAAQVILDNLLRGTQELANFAVGETLPNQGSHLRFLWSQDAHAAS